jgi:hypothetical protein
VTSRRLLSLWSSGYITAMSLVQLAEETVAIVERGSYELRSGARVDIRNAVDHAVGNTRLYYPRDSPPRLLGALWSR